MRPFLLAAAFSMALCSAASAQASAPSAQALYVERRGLMEVDARCRLFSPDIRSALEAGAGQAAGALLRGGWTRVRLGELEQAAVAAARARPCDDPRTISAVAAAQAGFDSWVHTHAMNFPGAERTWAARRTPDPRGGWRLSQEITAPAALFGVRERDGAQQLTLVLPLPSGQAAPSSAQLLMRDRTRASADILDLRGRTPTGLAAGAPSPATAAHFFASARRVEPLERGGRQAVFVFPDSAFQTLLTLDPREAVEVRLENGGATQRILIEVGDVAAARAFLAIGQR